MKIAAAVGHRFGGLRPPYATPHNRYRWKGTVGSPSIGTETLFRPSRPPLWFLRISVTAAARCRWSNEAHAKWRDRRLAAIPRWMRHDGSAAGRPAELLTGMAFGLSQEPEENPPLTDPPQPDPRPTADRRATRAGARARIRRAVQDDRSHWLTAREAGKRFGLSDSHVAHLCKRHPAIATSEPCSHSPTGYRYRVDPDALARLLALPPGQRKPRQINPETAARRARVIAYAPREGEITAAEAGRRLGMNRWQISRLCKRLPGFATRKTHGRWLIAEAAADPDALARLQARHKKRKGRPPRPRAREAGDARK